MSFMYMYIGVKPTTGWVQSSTIGAKFNPGNFYSVIIPSSLIAILGYVAGP